MRHFLPCRPAHSQLHISLVPRHCPQSTCSRRISSGGMPHSIHPCSILQTCAQQQWHTIHRPCFGFVLSHQAPVAHCRAAVGCCTSLPRPVEMAACRGSATPPHISIPCLPLNAPLLAIAPLLCLCSPVCPFFRSPPPALIAQQAMRFNFQPRWGEDVGGCSQRTAQQHFELKADPFICSLAQQTQQANSIQYTMACRQPSAAKQVSPGAPPRASCRSWLA